MKEAKLPNHYDVLGLPHGASYGDIRAAYRKLVRRYHPDAAQDLDPQQAASRLDKVLAAWYTLRDPEARAAYDLELGAPNAYDMRQWEPPPVPRGFALFPKAATMFSWTEGELLHRVADRYHRALSLEARGPDLSGLGDVPVWRLKVNHSQLDDSQLVHLRRMDGMFWLDLAGTKVGDDGMSHLAQLSNLNHLDLMGTRVTDEGLRAIGEIKSLEYLSLGETSVTDQGLAHLEGLTNLGALVLSGTQVQGPGLACLHGMQDLDNVRLPWRVKRGDRRKLQEALPRLRLL
ncbi:MAG TPA: DnaJ domain-containing protein [Actinomycetota bacterium]|nr:DnaJ domain-containing protein [Actinomycetota bacterium]